MNWLTSPLFYLGAILFSGLALCFLALWTQTNKAKSADADLDLSAWFLIGLLCIAILSILAFFAFTFVKPAGF